MAMKITLEANLKVRDDINKLIRSVRTGVIQRGLDNVLNKTIDGLKNKLFSVVNEEIRYKQPGKKGESQDDSPVDVPKSAKDLVKYIFNIDLDKVKSSADFTKLINDNAFVISGGRVRLQIPETPDGNMEQSYAQAVNKFRNSLFIDTSGPIPRYYIVNNFDPKPFVKIVCSRDKGVTDKSKKKYDQYKNSNSMPRQGLSEQGRFSEWSLSKEGVDAIKRASIDITPVIEKIQSGEYEDAVNLMNHSIGGKDFVQAKQQIQNIRDQKDLSPTLAAYTNIITLIKNLKIQKRILKDRTEYSLVSDSPNDETSQKNFKSELNRNITLWVMVNEEIWFNELVRIATQVIEGYEK